jgi:D-alanine-D-alanine ligase
MEVFLKERADREAYSYTNKEYCEELVEYRLVHDSTAQQAGDLALAAYRCLGLSDAGRVDLRADANGAPSFIEINPLAGLHPEHSDLPILCTLAGISYLELIGMIMRSVAPRLTVITSPRL